MLKTFLEKKLDYDISEQDRELPFKTTKETRLRVLQWKLLHNIYPTNIMLNRMKVAINNHCSYCPGEVDFIEHFFFFCPLTLAFWKQIENYILINCDTKLKINALDVFFGLQNEEQIAPKHKQTINHILLVGKMCISIFKKTNRHACMYSLFENHWNIRYKSTVTSIA